MDSSKKLPAGNDQEEPVGYKNPPTKNQFKKSRKSPGRPKGSKNRKTIVNAIASERHWIFDKGERKQLTVVELVMRRIMVKALTGKDNRAFDLMQMLLHNYLPEYTGPTVGVLVAPAPMTPEEWIAEQNKANLTRKPPNDWRGEHE